jgi:hypothetical protein
VGSLRKDVRMAIVAFIAVLAMLALLSYVGYDRWSAWSQVSVCVTPEQRDHLRAIMLKSIDQALDDQVGHLFATWVKDPTGQPKRAQTGLNNAIKAHIWSRASVLVWDPAECTSGMQLQSAGSKPWR